jgi:hypothetical protein
MVLLEQGSIAVPATTHSNFSLLASSRQEVIAARRWLVELGIPLVDAIEILKRKAMAFNRGRINGEMPWVSAPRRSNRRLLAVGEYCHHAAKL